MTHAERWNGFGTFYRSCSRLGEVNEYPAFTACCVMSGVKYSKACLRQLLKGATNTSCWQRWLRIALHGPGLLL